MGKMINTVLGPIEAKDLGKTLMHEHLIYGFCGFQGDYTLGGFDELLCIRENMKWLTPLKEKYGFRTIVDATNNECGRDPFFQEQPGNRRHYHHSYRSRYHGP